MKLKHGRLLLLLVFVCWCAYGCGYKGPLVLPQEPDSNETQQNTPPQTDNQPEES